MTSIRTAPNFPPCRKSAPSACCRPNRNGRVPRGNPGKFLFFAPSRTNASFLQNAPATIPSERRNSTERRRTSTDGDANARHDASAFRFHCCCCCCSAFVDQSDGQSRGQCNEIDRVENHRRNTFRFRLEQSAGVESQTSTVDVFQSSGHSRPVEKDEQHVEFGSR